jgi:transcriptional regulator with XRE-family HTH domain
MKPDSAAAIRARRGEAIKARRTALGLTQAALGDRIGVTKQAVYEWETGATTPRPSLQVAVARHLGTSHAALFGLDDG